MFVVLDMGMMEEILPRCPVSRPLISTQCYSIQPQMIILFIPVYIKNNFVGEAVNK